jgi:hypothetical protein
MEIYLDEAIHGYEYVTKCYLKSLYRRVALGVEEESRGILVVHWNNERRAHVHFQRFHSAFLQIWRFVKLLDNRHKENESILLNRKETNDRQGMTFDHEISLAIAIILRNEFSRLFYGLWQPQRPHF